MPDTAPTLSLEQKQHLYEFGYVVMPQAVSPELVEAARESIAQAKKGDNLGRVAAMTDLVNASDVTPIQIGRAHV